jgi:DNA repair protein RadC
MATRVKDMAKEDQPTYRALRMGFSALTTAELVQLVTQCKVMDSASQIVAQAGSAFGLNRLTSEDISAFPEVGPAAALALQAALELGRRAAVEAEDRVQIRTPADAAQVFFSTFGYPEQELFVVFCLDTRNRVVKTIELYRGCLNQCQVRVGEVFREAVRANAAAVIVAHNHPSGDPNPSPEDVALTRQLVEAGDLLGVEVLDHIVAGSGSRWISLRERGLGFEGA